MTTVFVNIFLTELSAQRRAPLIDDANELIEEHWTGAAGKRSSSQLTNP